MTAKTADNDVTAQMRAANPVSTAEIRAGIDEEQLRRAMGIAIAAGESPTQPVPADDSVANGPGTFRRRRAFSVGPRRVALLAGLACVGALAFVVLLPGAPGGGGPPAFAAAAIEVAEANPRLLVSEPGWTVTNANEFEADEGEVTFSDGTHTLYIHWYPARLYRSYLSDRADVSTPETSTLLGQTATTVHYGGTEYATMLSPQGPVFLEIRSELDSRAEYDAALRSLRPVDVDTWLGAMPPNVVRPEARGAAVEQMLRGVPLPPGFDAAVLRGKNSVSDHYQLAAEVADAVSCGWIESWIAARGTGDAVRAQEAVDAMAGSRHWPLMHTLIAGGGWGMNILLAAKELESGHLDHGAAGEVVNADGTGYELGPSWALGLECNSHIWRRPINP